MGSTSRTSVNIITLLMIYRYLFPIERHVSHFGSRFLTIKKQIILPNTETRDPVKPNKILTSLENVAPNSVHVFSKYMSFQSKMVLFKKDSHR